MTFEEAIRALQRANTKARLKPHAKPSGAGRPRRLTRRCHAGPSRRAAGSRAGAGPDRAGIVRRRAWAIAVGRRHPGRRPRPHPAALGGRSSQAGARRRQGGAAPRTAAGADRQPRRCGGRAGRPVEPAETAALTDAIEAAMSVATRARQVEPRPRRRRQPPEPRRAPARAARTAQSPSTAGLDAAAGATAAAAPQRLPQPPPARPRHRHSRPGPLRPARAPAARRCRRRCHAQPQPGFPNRPRARALAGAGERGRRAAARRQRQLRRGAPCAAANGPWPEAAREAGAPQRGGTHREGPAGRERAAPHARRRAGDRPRCASPATGSRA